MQSISKPTIQVVTSNIVSNLTDKLMITINTIIIPLSVVGRTSSSQQFLLFPRQDQTTDTMATIK